LPVDADKSALDLLHVPLELRLAAAKIRIALRIDRLVEFLVADALAAARFIALRARELSEDEAVDRV
jgi:hypothetical protein